MTAKTPKLGEGLPYASVYVGPKNMIEVFFSPSMNDKQGDIECINSLLDAAGSTAVALGTALSDHEGDHVACPDSIRDTHSANIAFGIQVLTMLAAGLVNKIAREDGLK